jgi:hypothetical protein
MPIRFIPMPTRLKTGTCSPISGVTAGNVTDTAGWS